MLQYYYPGGSPSWWALRDFGKPNATGELGPCACVAVIAPQQAWHGMAAVLRGEHHGQTQRACACKVGCYVLDGC